MTIPPARAAAPTPNVYDPARDWRLAAGAGGDDVPAPRGEGDEAMMQRMAAAGAAAPGPARA